MGMNQDRKGYFRCNVPRYDTIELDLFFSLFVGLVHDSLYQQSGKNSNAGY